MDLTELRKEIDEIDGKMVALYERRMGVACKIAEYKIENGMSVLDQSREEEKIGHVTGLAKDADNRQGIGELFRQIMALSRKVQERKLAEAGEALQKEDDIRKTSELIIYREPGAGDELLEHMIWLMEHYGEQEKREHVISVFHRCVCELVRMAEERGLFGNLWHHYLTHLLVNHENSFSRACEGRGLVTGSINQAVLWDMEVFNRWFHYDFGKVLRALQMESFDWVFHYEGEESGSGLYNRVVGERIVFLAGALKKSQTAGEMQKLTADFYREYGVGTLGLHKAFRVMRDDEKVWIAPITNMAGTTLDDLVGYELPKKKLIENTEAFIAGRAANNCLLFGDAGTGKSSSIKGIVNEYYGRGLRMIEIYKHQFRDLNDIISLVRNRNYKFIIYMDDLSFEDYEVEYKYLKAVIEGGLGNKPDNVLIYATSNRRHLIREKFSDKEERTDDLHKSDTVQEKLSLAARFGVRIYFGAPDRKEFRNIVKVLAERYGILKQGLMGEEELIREAEQWEMYHGGLSGRTARQFIDMILGRNGHDSADLCGH